MDIKPSIGQMTARDGKCEVVGRNGRGSLRLCILIATEGEDAEGAADLGSAEGGGFEFAEGAQFAGSALDDGAGDFVRKSGGFGAGTF